MSLLLLTASALTACNGGSSATAGEPSAADTGPAPIETQQASFVVETLASGLDHPWGLAFVTPDRILITERSGQLRIFEDGKLSEPVQGLPEIWVGGQGGLLDVAANQGWIYFSYSEPGSLPLTNSTAVARGKLNGRQLSELEVIFSQEPKYVSRAHFGSRLVFSGGYLFITLGERFSAKDDAQTLDNHHGKVVRIFPDGRVPEDNPYQGQDNALPEIWSIGHRNIQGATLHPTTGALWIHEHGPQGGDEINIPEPGENYGWPVITYGEKYGGGKIGEGTEKPGMEQPLYYWVPSIAPSGMTFYTGTAFPQWRGDLFVGSLKFRQLVRLELDGNEVVGEERMLQDAVGDRIRDVVQGPDGLLYLLTDEDNGRLLRLKPVTQDSGVR
ncbi:MAG: oxidoreductase [Pseudomonadales bacterium]|nr:oxidoreductase [Pseudomonadales bacterium]